MVATLSSTPDMLSDVLAGVLAGAVAAALTTPLDVIVTQTSTRSNFDGPTPGALQVGRR